MKSDSLLCKWVAEEKWTSKSGIQKLKKWVSTSSGDGCSMASGGVASGGVGGDKVVVKIVVIGRFWLVCQVRKYL